MPVRKPAYMVSLQRSVLRPASSRVCILQWIDRFQRQVLNLNRVVQPYGGTQSTGGGRPPEVRARDFRKGDCFGTSVKPVPFLSWIYDPPSPYLQIVAG